MFLREIAVREFQGRYAFFFFIPDMQLRKVKHTFHKEEKLKLWK